MTVKGGVVDAKCAGLLLSVIVATSVLIPGEMPAPTTTVFVYVPPPAEMSDTLLEPPNAVASTTTLLTGVALGFLTPLGGLGLWIGLAVGLTAVALMLFVRWRAKERAGFWAA